MRIFIGTLAKKEFQDFVRDTKQSLAKHKRQIEFTDLSALLCRYKYLGNNLDDKLIDRLGTSLKELVEKYQLKAFVHPLTKVMVGDKGAHDIDVVKIKLKQDNSILEWYRIVNALVLEAIGDAVPRKQDLPSLQGLIKIASVRRNVKVKDKQAILEKFKEMGSPASLSIDNLTIFGRELVKGKVNTRIFYTVPL